MNGSQGWRAGAFAGAAGSRPAEDSAAVLNIAGRPRAPGVPPSPRVAGEAAVAWPGAAAGVTVAAVGGVASPLGPVVTPASDPSPDIARLAVERRAFSMGVNCEAGYMPSASRATDAAWSGFPVCS